MNAISLPLTCAVLLAAVSTSGRPLIVAHRGSSYDAPENTVSAARLAWEHNADALEFDVHLSRDKKVVVIHDSTTSRTAGKPWHVARTSSEALRTLDVGRWKSPRYEGEKMPFAEEMLETVPPGKLTFVEIKSTSETVPHVREAIRSTGRQKEAVIIGFDLDTMTAAKEAMPEIPVYWLKGTAQDKNTGKYLPHGRELIQKALERGLDGLDVQYRGVTPEFVRAVHEAGLELHVWTVDDPEAAKDLARMGVDSITTNRPDLIREALSKQAEPAAKSAN